MLQSDVQNLMAGNHLDDSQLYPDLISDHYDEIGFFVYYDNKRRVEALEFYEPANIFLNKVNLLKIQAVDAYDLVCSLDKDAVINSDGLTSFKLGVGFYAPYYSENSLYPVESVIVFKQGYYDSIDFN